LELVGSQEDTVEVVTSNQKISNSRPISLNLGKNIVDFVVTGEGEVHSWHAVIKVDDEVVFEHQQSRFPTYSCGDEMYRYRMLFTVTAHPGTAYYVIATAANLREQPTLDAKVVGKLPISTQVEIQRTDNSSTQWVEVVVLNGDQKGQRGWFSSDYLVSERPTVK
jgi:uncharacterized protein YgiM (DUF1202 family)